MQCKTCNGTGKIDDADFGDTQFNEYPCPDCKGKGNSKLNLLAGKFHCCGALCPKQEAQKHIDRMQRAIDAAYEYMVYGGYSPDLLKELTTELEELTLQDSNPG